MRMKRWIFIAGDFPFGGFCRVTNCALKAKNSSIRIKCLSIRRLSPPLSFVPLHIHISISLTFCVLVKLGSKHPDPVVETSSLASVDPPEVTYQLRFDSSAGNLSSLQLEAIIYASQRHMTRLPNSHRAGFFIGDGAGVGKGRTIAGIIAENFLRQRKRAIWFSVSNDLKIDAERDLRDIGAGEELIRVEPLNKVFSFCYLFYF